MGKKYNYYVVGNPLENGGIDYKDHSTLSRAFNPGPKSKVDAKFAEKLEKEFKK